MLFLCFVAQLTQLMPPTWSTIFSWITWYPDSIMVFSMVFWSMMSGLYSIIAFSAAKLTVACFTPFNLESAFSMVSEQFMQLMPPMLRVIFLFFSSIKLLAFVWIL